MAQSDVRTVLNQIKKGSINNLYYLYGLNISGVEKLTQQIIKKIVGDNEDFALNKLNGKNINISDLSDMIQMMPMMSEYNCILINDYNCEEQNEDTNKRLIDTLKEIPEQTVVIFNITGFDVKCGKKTITGKNKKLTDFVAKNGILCEQGIKASSELAKDIVAKISSRGGMISISNAQELAEMCLSDTLMIENEIDKLCSYACGREISHNMLHELVSQQNNTTIYNLADAVASFNKKTAFSALDELMSQRIGRGALLGTISSSFMDLYRASCAKQFNKSQHDVMADFGYKWEFMVKNAFRNSSSMSLRRLRNCLAILRDTAVQLNSSSSDERVVLEQAVTKMLMTKN